MIAIECKWVSRDYKDFIKFRCFDEGYSFRRPSLCVDSLLHVRVYSYHAVVEVWVLAHKYLGIPRHRNENGVDTAAQGSGEDVA